MPAPCPTATATRSGQFATHPADDPVRALLPPRELPGEPDADSSMAYYFWLLRRGPRRSSSASRLRPGGRSTARSHVPCRGAVDALRAPGLRVDRRRLHLGARRPSTTTTSGTVRRGSPRQHSMVPRLELDFRTSPMARASTTPLARGNRRDRARRRGCGRRAPCPIDGSEEIVDGITAVTVDGHSPGEQVILVQASAGMVVLASDAAHFWTTQLERPFAVLHDLAQMYAVTTSSSSLRAGAPPRPGHDPDVARRFKPVARQEPARRSTSDDDRDDRRPGRDQRIHRPRQHGRPDAAGLEDAGIRSSATTPRGRIAAAGARPAGSPAEVRGAARSSPLAARLPAVEAVVRGEDGVLEAARPAGSSCRPQHRRAARPAIHAALAERAPTTSTPASPAAPPPPRRARSRS